jgi:UDP-N-acetylglucosamine 3-dehydrogenase
MLPIRAAIAGLGVMGSNHLRVLNAMADVEVVAVADPRPEARAAVTTAHPRLRVYEDLEALLAAMRPDVVCLAAPVALLPRLGQAVLEAGIPVMLEKPMAPDSESAQRLTETAAERGVPLAVGYVERFNPAVSAVKAMIDEGAIGRVYQMHARRLSPFPSREALLGVALDLGSHDIDVMRYLTGAEVERVFAESAQRVHDRAEDLICATLRFDTDVTGLLEVNWLTPTKVRQLSVTGEKGMLVVDYLTQELFLYESPESETKWQAMLARGPHEGDMRRFSLPRREPLAVEWQSFLAAIRDGTVPAVGGRDALAAISTAEAIQLSGELHQVVTPGYRQAQLA